ncbi:MAG: GNAT family N-acetyltransferase [Allosphingosinicella sp.]
MSERIRPFAAADAEAVNALALAAFAQYEGVYDDWEALRRGVGAMAELAGQGEIVVAEDEGGGIVGAVAYFAPGTSPRADFFEPEWPIVRMLVVDPAARGRGLGRRLTGECVARARRDGAASIALHTSPAMEAALALYLKLGFGLERQLPDRFGVPYGLYLMDLRKGPAS